MDDNKKAKILAHIDSIIAYAKQPGNEWLLDALRERLSNNEKCSVTDDRIDKIEHYLALDYSIDDIKSNIDYSFIDDDLLKKKLESDWREMLRFRFYVRQHKPNFYEYCRYANLQIEGLLNYYCSKKYKTDEAVIRRYKDVATKKAIDDIVRVYYHHKIAIASADFSIEVKYKYVFDNVYKIRNQQSHRSSEFPRKSFINERAIVIGLINEYGLPPSAFDAGIVDYNVYKRNSLSYGNKFEGFRVDVESRIGIDYWDYTADNWAHKSPYYEVDEALACLSSKVKENV